MLSPTAKPTLLPGAILCKSIPHSEIKNKMSSTERHIRGAQIEKKPRVMLIDYSENAFPQSNNEERAWDRSPEPCMKNLNSSPASTDLPVWGAYLEQLCKAAARVSPGKNKHSLPFSSPLNQAPTRIWEYLYCACSGVCPTFFSTESLGMGRRVLLILGRHSARDTGKINNALWRFQTKPAAGAEGSYFNPQLQVTGHNKRELAKKTFQDNNEHSCLVPWLAAESIQ